MKQFLIGILLLALLATLWPVLEGTIIANRPPVRITPPLPAHTLQLVSLGHNQALAESLFFKVMFYNEFRAEQDGLPPDLATTMDYLDTAVQLDPYTVDSYYYGQALLSDHLNYVKPLNKMLERSLKVRPWDHYLSWFLGVNNYFILQNKEQAGHYFKMTAHLHPESSFYTTFAARSMKEGGETELAVLFLREMYNQSNSKLVQSKIIPRLKAFETVLFLEEAMGRYRTEFGSLPTNLNDLVTGNILTAIPPDPYGGKFYLDQDGHINTSSSFSFKDKK